MAAHGFDLIKFSDAGEMIEFEVMIRQPLEGGCGHWSLIGSDYIRTWALIF